ncbi:MAG: tetratricopeptide repeat protein [Candidatus Micrarchaeia archaeon]
MKFKTAAAVAIAAVGMSLFGGHAMPGNAAPFQATRICAPSGKAYSPGPFSAMAMPDTIIKEVKGAQPGNLASALSALRNAPQNDTLCGEVASIYYGLSQFGKAGKYYGKAAAIAPSQPMWQYALGDVAFTQSKHSDAIVHYEKAISLAGSEAAGSYAGIFFRLGLCYSELGTRLSDRKMMEKGVDALSRSIQLGYSVVDCLSVRIGLYSLLGNAAAAQKDYETLAGMLQGEE